MTRKSSRLLRTAAVLILGTVFSGCEGQERGTPATSLKPSKVLRTTKRVAKRLVTLRTETGTIVTTPEHPFAKLGTGWTRAADLRVGNRIESSSSVGGVMILDTKTFDAPATTVYNLTVATTHAYFVGPRGLLVHNVCGRPGGRERLLLAQQEEQRRNEVRQRLNESEAREAARQEREARARAERQGSGINDEPGRPNCVYCTLTGLSDFDRLSVFLEKTGLNRSNAGGTHSPNGQEFQDLLRNFGLTSPDTPPAQNFPPSASQTNEAANAAKEGSPRPIFPYGEQATELMQKSQANTFAIAYAYWDGSSYKSHVLLAVKKRERTPDGSIVDVIVYLDLQKRPPETYHYLDPHHFSVLVTPTDIDWRFNRTIYGYVETRPPMLQQPDHFRPAP